DQPARRAVRPGPRLPGPSHSGIAGRSWSPALDYGDHRPRRAPPPSSVDAAGVRWHRADERTAPRTNDNPPAPAHDGEPRLRPALDQVAAYVPGRPAGATSWKLSANENPY